MTIEFNRLSNLVDYARCNSRAIPQLSESVGELSLHDAYEIQKLAIELSLERGARLVGAKMGFTSREKMEQMGVDDLIIGRLTDRMAVEDGGTLDPRKFIHPRVEPEVAYFMREPIRGNITRAQALASVAAVAPALEIIDSRYQDFQFNILDVVADNASAAAYAVGPARSIGLDVAGFDVELILDGQATSSGSTNAILGDPALALVEAARLAEIYDIAIGAGDVVLAGAATAAVPFAPGSTATVKIAGLGEASVTMDAT